LRPPIVESGADYLRKNEEEDEALEREQGLEEIA
jgi:hypothetical protein